jgi:hypothetical protein
MVMAMNEFAIKKGSPEGGLSGNPIILAKDSRRQAAGIPFECAVN